MRANSIASLPEKQFPPEQQSWSARDTQLYALGFGIGNKPCDEFQLSFLQGNQPRVLLTQAAVLAASSEWMHDSSNGIDGTKLVALSHKITLDQGLPTNGLVQSPLRVTQVLDRGVGRGAVIHWHRELYAANGERLATVEGRAIARGNGGFGGIAPSRQKEETPLGAPAKTVVWPTHQGQALLYSLSGDKNALHIDPKEARAAGCAKPILHGFCSLGVCAFAVESVATEMRANTRIAGISGHYAGVAYPGETLQVEVWKPKGTEMRFRCLIADRGAPVIEDGFAWLFTDNLSQ